MAEKQRDIFVGEEHVFDLLSYTVEGAGKNGGARKRTRYPMVEAIRDMADGFVDVPNLRRDDNLISPSPEGDAKPLIAVLGRELEALLPSQIIDGIREVVDGTRPAMVIRGFPFGSTQKTKLYDSNLDNTLLAEAFEQDNKKDVGFYKWTEKPFLQQHGTQRAAKFIAGVTGLTGVDIHEDYAWFQIIRDSAYYGNNVEERIFPPYRDVPPTPYYCSTGDIDSIERFYKQSPEQGEPGQTNFMHSTSGVASNEPHAHAMSIFATLTGNPSVVHRVYKPGHKEYTEENLYLSIALKQGDMVIIGDRVPHDRTIGFAKNNDRAQRVGLATVLNTHRKIVHPSDQLDEAKARFMAEKQRKR